MKITRNAVLCLLSLLLVCTALLTSPEEGEENTSLPVSAETEAAETQSEQNFPPEA